MRLVAYLVVLVAAPIGGMLVGMIASAILSPLRGQAESAAELIEAIIEGAAAIVIAVVIFRLLGPSPNLDVVGVLLLAYGYNDHRRQKRADGMVAAHAVVSGDAANTTATAIVGQSPIDAAGWAKLQTWERVRAWGHGIGIVVAGLAALAELVPAV